jgi:zinc protease
MADKLCEIAKKELYTFAENGPTEAELSMAIENLKKNIPESRISNSYWMDVLSDWNDFGIDSVKEYEDAVNSVTAEDVKKLLTKILKQNNFIEFNSTPKGLN